ncbi:hypothetical protein [Pseudonocardia alni]|uniref:hypothetical protein n=1 Tax=Pseudonocardia alni TaxID=33907 RepID=UPI00280AA3A5|nr:hypothetical protein [Pseudonocardia alni]
MSVSERLAEYAARNYERQAATTNNPRKQAKLRGKAAEERRKAGLPQPGQTPPPPVDAGRPGAGMDAPTVRLGAVPTAGRSVEVREGGVGLQEKIKVGVVGLMCVGALIGCVNYMTSDEETTATAAGTTGGGSSYSTADVEACDIAGEQMRTVGAIDLSQPPEDAAMHTFAAAEQVQGAASTADDRALTRQLGDGAALLRDMGATVAPNLTPREEVAPSAGDAVFGPIVETCRGVYAAE